MEASEESRTEVISGLVGELSEIERSARAALVAVEGVLEQAETSRRAVELVLVEIEEFSASLVAGRIPGAAINKAPALSQGARVLAVQLAASGASREEVTERLRGDFGIEDTDDVLDAIFRRVGTPSGEPRRKGLLGRRRGGQ